MFEIICTSLWWRTDPIPNVERCSIYLLFSSSCCSTIETLLVLTPQEIRYFVLVLQLSQTNQATSWVQPGSVCYMEIVLTSIIFSIITHSWNIEHCQNMIFPWPCRAHLVRNGAIDSTQSTKTMYVRWYKRSALGQPHRLWRVKRGKVKTVQQAQLSRCAKWMITGPIAMY